jgi:hypothetical protein
MTWLDKQGISYLQKNVEEDSAVMAEFMTVNDGMIGTPFTIIENDGSEAKIAGFNPSSFTTALQQ